MLFASKSFVYSSFWDLFTKKCVRIWPKIDLYSQTKYFCTFKPVWYQFVFNFAHFLWRHTNQTWRRRREVLYVKKFVVVFSLYTTCGRRKENWCRSVLFIFVFLRSAAWILLVFKQGLLENAICLKMIFFSNN